MYLLSKYCSNSIGIRNGINKAGGTYDKKTPLIRLISSKKCTNEILANFLNLSNIDVNITYQETYYDENDEKKLSNPLNAIQICQEKGQKEWAKMIQQYQQRHSAHVHATVNTKPSESAESKQDDKQDIKQIKETKQETQIKSKASNSEMNKQESTPAKK